MIHFSFLVGFALCVGVAFGAFSSGSVKEKVLYGFKIVGQFLVVSLALAWLFYFLPW
jgi:hypothetical protein